MTGSPSVATPRRPDLALVVAGMLTCGMALYHFWLPHAFHWGDALTRAPALRWGLFMINASFSYLLLAGGALTLRAAFAPAAPDRTRGLVLRVMGGYWLFNLLYQIASPLPLPPGLTALRWAFLGFAAAVVLLYGAALVGRRAGPAPSPGAAGSAAGRAPQGTT